MSKPIFTWSPNLGSIRKLKPNVNKTQFGDGYEQRTPSGINYMPRTWQLQFSYSWQEGAADILAFLDTQAGTQSFIWTDPLNDTNTYVCREWGASQQMFGVYQITANFEQVFEF